MSRETTETMENLLSELEILEALDTDLAELQGMVLKIRAIKEENRRLKEENKELRKRNYTIRLLDSKDMGRSFMIDKDGKKTWLS